MPSAVNEYSCIVGEYLQNRRYYFIVYMLCYTVYNRTVLQLVHKHQTETGFELDRIQEDILVHFIAGKLPIGDCRTKLCKSFHYMAVKTEKNKVQHPTEYVIIVTFVHYS